MTLEQTSLVLEHLRAMRADLGTLREDMEYLKQAFVGLRNDVHAYRGDLMRLENRTEARLDKIERRLDLHDTPN
jgi:hypothetical protein